MDLPKGVQHVRKRLKDGSYVHHYYWRATRRKLPDPDDPSFAAAVDQARLSLGETAAAGTFKALVVDYKRSPLYRNLKPKTRAAYDRVLERLRDLERASVADIRRRDILVLRDGMAVGRPQAANQLVGVLGVLMQFAVDREWRETNPCLRIGRIKGGHHARWPEAAIQYAYKHFAEEYRRAVTLALYTGQREGDCVTMRWDQYDGTAIAVVQQKTGAHVWIPVHKDLKRELDRWERKAETILTNSYGNAWGGTSFATRFCTIMKEHRAMDGLVFHGLRKAAAAKLAEAGCSTKEIASITGHATLQMVELYTREAEQKRLAKRAMRRLELVSGRGVNQPKPEE